MEGARGAYLYEGTGIGLALVRELVRLHGGTVGVDESASVAGSDLHGQRSLWCTAHLPQATQRVAAGVSTGLPGRHPNAFVVEALRWLPEEPPSAAPAARPRRPPRVERG